MKWLVSKGETISELEKLFIEVSDTFSKDEPRISRATLLGWDGNYQPRRDVEGPFKICDLYADLSGVPPEKFTKVENEVTGESISIATFKIEITGLNTELQCRLLFDGTEYGTVKWIYY
jgi:hypothetical protein